MKYKTPAVISTLLFPAVMMLHLAYAANTYGPTTATETLWNIAERNRPDSSITVQQMMIAIQTKNPLAFTDGNLNGLKESQYLAIPSLDEVKQITQQQAVKETALNNRAWKQMGSMPLNASARLLKEQLQREISTLRERLTQEQQRSQNLTEQIKQEQAKNAELTMQLKQLQDANTSVKTSITQPTNSVDSAKLNTELTELKQLLEERDTHIQNLQASLREASITIKRQYAESVALHKQLTTLDPNAKVELPPEPLDLTQTPPKASLTLGEVETDKNTVSSSTTSPSTDKTGQSIAFADQVKPETKNSADNATHAPTNSLKDLIQHQAADANKPMNTNEYAMGNTPSKLTLVVALLALVFVLAAVWRSYAQRRALQREEQRLLADLDNPEVNSLNPSSTQAAAA